MIKTLVSIEKAFETEWNTPFVRKNKCPWCDYSCKTRGWRNGVTQHILHNHPDKNIPVSQKQRIKYFIRQQILALLKEIEGELPKEIKGTEKWSEGYLWDKGFNSAIEKVKVILQNKMEEAI